MHGKHQVDSKLVAPKYCQTRLNEFQSVELRKPNRTFGPNNNTQTFHLPFLVRKPIKLTPIKLKNEKKSKSKTLSFVSNSRWDQNFNFPESLWTLKFRKDSKIQMQPNGSELSTKSNSEFRKSLTTVNEIQQPSDTETNSYISELSEHTSTFDRKIFKASIVFSDLMDRYDKVMRRGSKFPVKKVNEKLLLIPSRRIQTLSALPEDSMAKITGKISIPTLGFMVREKTESQIVEPDPELLRQANYISACEKVQGKNIFISDSAKLLGRSAKNIDELESVKLSSIASDSEKKLFTEVSSLTSYSSLSTASLMDSEEEPFMDDEVAFHFNPVVQIRTDQKPWKSDLPNKDVPSTSKSTTSEYLSEEKSDETQPVESALKSNDEDDGEGTNFDLLYENLQYVDSKIYEKESSKSLSTVFEVNSQIDTSTDVISDPIWTPQPIRKKKSKDFRSFARRTTPLPQTSSQLASIPSLKETLASAVSEPKADEKQWKISTHTSQSKVRSHYSLRSVTSNEDIRSFTDSENSCFELMKAMEDPNPNIWFDLMEDKMAKLRRKGDLREKHHMHFPLRGLRRHFLAIPHGFEGVRDELNKNWEFRIKPEILLTSMIRNHLLKMPLTVKNPEMVKKMYWNTIVKYPLLYKMILDRREILPVEIQRFLSRILELTDTSDKVLSSITSSTTKLAAITIAAKEMDASGYLTGGPMPLPRNSSELTEATSSRSDKNPDAVPLTRIKSGKKDSGQGQTNTYTADKDIDKGFYIGLRDPCQNILEEVALQFPEFALHIRPLFEYRWANIEADYTKRMKKLNYFKDQNPCPSVVSSHGLINQIPNNPTNGKRQTCTTLQSTNLSSTDIETVDPKTSQDVGCILLLFERVIVQLTMADSILPGQSVWSDLLICLHMSNYFVEVSNALVHELDHWIPPLIIGLESPYQTVREEICCVLAYLVSTYQLVTRLHVKSKNVLVSNIIIGLFLASKHYPQTYPFYHGVIGYMLHSIPCISILDCILTWLTCAQNDKSCPISRDWGLFVYYILRHWPQNLILIDPMFQRKLVKQLETGLLMKHSKKASRLALGYLIRTFKIRSAVLTCWPDQDGNSLVE